MNELQAAARAIREASALLVTAGAGLGVDSGLPDFRGDQGFWKAYPPYAKLGLSFIDLANPRWFETDPSLAWGFYGHRLALYRETVPHEGFAILKRWCDAKPDGGFVFTSNVDGQFQRAGFDPARIYECHGAIDYLQCTSDCGVGILRADDFTPAIDASFRCTGELPKCPRCSALMRPNVLMFGDFGWDESRSAEQARRFEKWLQNAGKIAIVECGAGTAVPTVRNLGDRLATHGRPLVRINLREPHVPRGHHGLPLGALAALRSLDGLLREEPLKS
ncbi:MAG: SIR2 family NAD-dependent protein deacylase [Polyangiales bacterium]